MLSNLSISASHMFATALFAWSDDGIGRFVRSMLSQQDLMELFIFGMNDQRRYVAIRMIRLMYVNGRGEM